MLNKFLYSSRHILNKTGLNLSKNKFSQLQRNYTDQKASDYIKRLLDSKEPIMIARFGSVELNCIIDYLNKKNKFRYLKYLATIIDSFEFSKSTKEKAFYRAGIFPSTDLILSKFSELILNESSELDILGSWKREECVIRNYFHKSTIINLSDIEPYYHEDPWSSILEGKNILVIHPFADTINNQYKNNREKLFKNPKVLPSFNLITLKAIQSVSYMEKEFVDWFDALEHMKKQILKIEFDIAIIGCGAYGFPLASFIKKLGKKAIHMGGATQILFGIRGKRWDKIPFFQSLINHHWVRPSIEEVPPNSNLVEDSCYW